MNTAVSLSQMFVKIGAPGYLIPRLKADLIARNLIRKVGSCWITDETHRDAIRNVIEQRKKK